MWYRTINPVAELQILSVREPVDLGDLRRQTRIPPEGYNRHENPFAQGFTSVSAFQFLIDGVKQDLFSNNNIGILVGPSSRNVTWRASGYTSVSDNIFKSYHNRNSFDRMLREHNFKVVNEDKLANIVKSDFNELVRKYDREGYDSQEAKLAWTEGLFRYKIGEMAGIVIDPGDNDNISSGYAFRMVVEKITKVRLSIFQLDQRRGFPVKISTKQLFDQLKKSKKPKEYEGILSDVLAKEELYHNAFYSSRQPA